MELDVKNKLEGGLTFKVSRFKEVIKKTRPHKHDAYFELVFLSEGEGLHWIEEEEFRVKAPEFYLLQPGQVHYWQFTAVPKGFVVLFTEGELDALTERSLVDLLMEAKRYVLHTDHSINEIADLLHFNDASHFVKFFKRHEGSTPLQFRNRHFK